MNILIKKLLNDVVSDTYNTIVYVTDDNQNSIEAHLCNESNIDNKIKSLRTKFRITV